MEVQEAISVFFLWTAGSNGCMVHWQGALQEATDRVTIYTRAINTLDFFFARSSPCGAGIDADDDDDDSAAPLSKARC